MWSRSLSGQFIRDVGAARSPRPRFLSARRGHAGARRAGQALFPSYGEWPSQDSRGTASVVQHVGRPPSTGGGAVRALNPPFLATWLLLLTDSNPWIDAVAGDLFEEYQRRRSSTWYWCQVLPVTAVAFVKDLRHHWVLAIRALVAAVLFLIMSHDLWQALRLSRLTTAAIPLLGLWPTIFLFAWLEPFFLCATAGVAVAVTHRKCQVSLVLLYAAASFAFCVWIGMNHLRTIQE